MLYAFEWREAMAFKVASTNAVALACQWQLVFTFLMAYVLTSDTFNMNQPVSERDGWHVVVSTVLMLATLAMLGFGFYQQYVGGAPSLES